MSYTDFKDCIIAAHRASEKFGYAFAVQWPDGHCTVERMKPAMRTQNMKVICCEDGFEKLA